MKKIYEESVEVIPELESWDDAKFDPYWTAFDEYTYKNQ
jgi:hypothetical protein